MNILRFLAVLMIVLGLAGLVYGGVTYTKNTHTATVGSVEFSVQDRKTVNIPIWAGMGLVALGGAILVYFRKNT